MKKRLIGLVCLLLFASALFVGCGNDQENGKEEAVFPESEITLICPFTAGGGYDLQLRAIAPYWSKYLGVPVVVVNEGGGGGITGAQSVWNAKPDGYTLLQAPVTNWLVVQIQEPDAIAFRLSKFEWIGQYQEDIRGLAVNTSLGVETWDDLVELSKERPLKYGSPGIGSAIYNEGALLEEVTGIKLDHVIYAGTNEMRGAFARNEIDLSSIVYTTLIPWEKDGDVDIACVMSDERQKYVENTPTAEEFGMPGDLLEGFVFSPLMGTSRGVVAPPETPDDVLKVLRETFMKAVNDEEYVASLEKQKLLHHPMEGAEYADYVKQLEVKMEEMEDFINTIQQQ